MSRTERMKCAVEGCVRTPSVTISEARVCLGHYRRFRAKGEFGEPGFRAVLPRRSARGVCVIDGCENIDAGPRGFCKMHQTRIDRHGDPSTVVPYSERQKKGDNAPAWAGDSVTYAGMHIRLRTLRGSASKRKCVDCGKSAAQWSYTLNAGERERTGPEGKYSVSVDDYEPRCVPCHKRYDLARTPSWGRKFDAATVIATYLSGRGYKSIAAELHVSEHRIKAALLDAGIQLRGSGGIPGLPKAKRGYGTPLMEGADANGSNTNTDRGTR